MPKFSAPKPGDFKQQKPKRGRPPKPRDSKGNVIPEASLFKYDCVCCGRSYDTPQKNFLTSRSVLFRAWNGYVPICRECISSYYNEEVLPAFDYNEAKAVEYICGIFDWPYDDEILEASKNVAETYRDKNDASRPVIVYYNSRLNMKNWSKKAHTYLQYCNEKVKKERAAMFDFDPNEEEKN